MKKSKQKTNGRSLKYMVILATMIIMITQLGWNFYHVDQQYANVQVRSGDTVWAIANTASDGTSDVRSTVYDIVKVNGLSGNDDIYPGQILKVPVNSESLSALQQRFVVK